jgi:hypothetical protein
MGEAIAHLRYLKDKEQVERKRVKELYRYHSLGS